ncbi:hypothetical protein MTP99_015251 [Tenebrio molitor]|nr:hypothetical protein MTP99_015251 [Tenebrio molitor]
MRRVRSVGCGRPATPGTGGAARTAAEPPPILPAAMQQSACGRSGVGVMPGAARHDALHRRDRRPEAVRAIRRPMLRGGNCFCLS